MSNTKNLGQVSGIFIGTSSPKNTSIIWYDNTPSQKCHKVYDPVINDWKALSPDIVSNTTYSELVVNANKNGLSIGKHYVITDKSNILAIAITSTKVQYHDSLGNILIDDLGTNIQYHVSSGNLLIDDINGVFDVDKNKLIFQFQEQERGDSTDYLFGKIRVGTKWILSKFSFQSLISKENNNSVSWNNGIFFSFKNTISKILDKSGGIVSYDTYNSKIDVIDKNIENVSKENQTIIENTESLVDKKTTDVAIFGKKLQNNIDITTTPGDVIRGDTLYTIISKFQRWINKFKYATGISLSRNFTDAKSQQYINNNDTVESALGKVQYMLKNPATSSALPENWTELSDIQNVSYPEAKDSFELVFKKIVAKFKQLGDISYRKLVADKVTIDLSGKTNAIDLKHTPGKYDGWLEEYGGLRIYTEENHEYPIYDIILNRIKLDEIIYRIKEVDINDFGTVLPSGYNFYIIKGNVDDSTPTTSICLPGMEQGSVIFIVNLTTSSPSRDIYLVSTSNEYYPIITNSNSDYNGITTTGYCLAKQGKTVGIVFSINPFVEGLEYGSYLQIF